MSQPFIIQIGELPDEPYPFRVTTSEDVFLKTLLRARNPEKELVIRPIERNRSIQQNRALWKLAYPEIAERMGEENLMAVHRTMLAEYFLEQGGSEAARKSFHRT